MKKSIVLCAAALLISMTSLFANPVNGVNEKALSNFQKEFVNAKEVTWESTPLFVRVSFMLNEKPYTAYYNAEGERIAIARNLVSFELPISLQDELKQSYPNFWISDLFDFQGKDDAAYYITIENADYRITLKSVGINEWITYKKSQKS